MTQHSVQIIANADKFHNAEQLWFWFLYSKSVQNGFAPHGNRGGARVCELMDVEMLISKLYLAGKLTDEQLEVLKKFGDRRRAPHQYIWTENRAAARWAEAMTVIGDAARMRGWVE